jgi:preprotein translocase SecF subunit
MFEIFVGARFKFMEKRRGAYLLSGILVLASIVSLVIHGGPRESIDFTGGTVLFVEFTESTPTAVVRAATERAGMEGAEVQMAEENTQAIIHFRVAEGDTSNQFGQFRTAFTAEQGAGADSVLFLSQETVGPKIGSELEQKATLAILWSLVLILGYIAWRFTRFTFGLGAVIALFHDIVITLGLFSILDREVSLTVIAAFLTIGGYSINDTIVVFDRIRENLGLSRRITFQEIINRSVNQTLSRTILTAGTTLLAVLSLFFLGGTVIHDFAIAMLMGVLVGTYSSIFVASALALDLSNWWNRRKEARASRTPAKAAASS